MLDFEAASRGKFIFDLATAVNALCFVGERYDLKRFEALIGGYESLRTLSLAEWDAFPNELRFSALRFTVTRLHDFFLRPVDESQRINKDFREFYDRLRILRRETEGGMEGLLMAMATGYDYRKVSEGPGDREEREVLSGEEHVRALLRTIGEDPEREGLLKTPERVTRALEYLTKGYNEDPTRILNEALFSEEYSEMIVLKDLDFFSLCEHHLLPFFGKAHVAYIPNHKILGLSKLARLFEVFARRLQVQERLTTQVANCLMEAIEPQGVGVVVEAEHLCMRMRGVEKQNSVMVTSAMLGSFRDRLETREEFMTLINGHVR